MPTQNKSIPLSPSTFLKLLKPSSTTTIIMIMVTTTTSKLIVYARVNIYHVGGLKIIEKEALEL